MQFNIIIIFINTVQFYGSTPSKFHTIHFTNLKVANNEMLIWHGTTFFINKLRIDLMFQYLKFVSLKYILEPHFGLIGELKDGKM